MTLIEKINSAKTQHDLDLLAMEVILNRENFKDGIEAFNRKMKELEKENEGSKKTF